MGLYTNVTGDTQAGTVHADCTYTGYREDPGLAVSELTVYRASGGQSSRSTRHTHSTHRRVLSGGTTLLRRDLLCWIPLTTDLTHRSVWKLTLFIWRGKLFNSNITPYLVILHTLSSVRDATVSPFKQAGIGYLFTLFSLFQNVHRNYL